MAISRTAASEYYRGVNKEKIDCPVCQSTHHQKLFDRDRFGMGIETVGCEQCGLIFVNPRPTAHEMSLFYRDHYRDFYEAIEIPTQEYIEKGPFEKRAHFVIEKLSVHLSGSSGKSLDVGCSEGTFLKRFKQHFPTWDSFGLEPDPHFAKFANENSSAVEVFNSDFQEFFASCSSRFDLITLSHVLEHLLNPLDDLQAIRQLLGEGGLFYVEVPNVADSEVRGIANIHLGHVSSFSPTSLKSVLALAGFEIIDFFDKGLPAQTKSMAALCRKSESPEGPAKVQWPNPDEIRTTLLDFQSRCCPPRKNRKRSDG